MQKARHDFKSEYVDLEAWYPKIKTSSFMSGHDCISTQKVRIASWSHRGDGSVGYSLQWVKGAVNLFPRVRGHYVRSVLLFFHVLHLFFDKGEHGPVQGNELLHFIDFKCNNDSAC